MFVTYHTHCAVVLRVAITSKASQGTGSQAYRRDAKVILPFDIGVLISK